MKNLLLFFTSILLAGIFQSCEKDSDSSSDSSTENKSIITSNVWIVTDLTLDGSSVYDLFFEDCEKDDEVTYKSDDTYFIEGGQVKCDPSDPEVIETGSWKMINNTTVEIDGDLLYIESINSSRMTLWNEDSDGTITKLIFTSI